MQKSFEHIIDLFVPPDEAAAPWGAYDLGWRFREFSRVAGVTPKHAWQIWQRVKNEGGRIPVERMADIIKNGRGKLMEAGIKPDDIFDMYSHHRVRKTEQKRSA